MNTINTTDTYNSKKQMRRRVSEHTSKFDLDYTEFANIVYT